MSTKNIFLRLIDLIIYPFLFVILLLLKEIRRVGFFKLPLAKKAFLKVGVFPILDHYYEPLFNPKHLNKPLSNVRNLPGINWNIQEQINLLKSFSFQSELENIPNEFVDDIKFHFENGAFESGDAEYWYQIIRQKKPKRIIEIGSGNSTKMARLAIEANGIDTCIHTCIEPYEMPWLEKIGVNTIRQKVEDVDINIFKELESNDILFIDSSHVIRPQGDVLFEYLEILPILNTGVIVHIHDIFSPRDYPKEWLVDEIRLWNEQYLLEAFLTSNPNWKIIGALNFLKHHDFDLLKEKCDRLTLSREPASLYMVKL